MRAAACDAAGELKLSDLSSPLESLLDDPEAFVRYKAVKGLSALEGKSASRRLQVLFTKEDSLKGPIAEALTSLEVPLPKSFGPALDGKEPGVLLAVLQGLEEARGETGVANLWLPARLAEHADGDVACAALRLLTVRGADKPAHRDVIVHALQSGGKEKQLAVLQSIPATRERETSSYGWSGWDSLIEESEGGQPTGLVDEVFGAFMGAESAVSSRTAQAASPTKAAPRIDDVFAAFLEAAPAREETNATGAVRPDSAQGGAPKSALRGQIRQLLKSPDAEVAMAAALALLRLGELDSLPYLRGKLEAMTAGERQQLAASLPDAAKPDCLDLLKRLIEDSVSNVREAAADRLRENLGSPACADAFFAPFLKPETPLQPEEVFNSSIEYYAEKTGAQRQVRRWAIDLLAKTGKPPLRRMALALLETAGRKEDAAAVKPYLDSREPLTRRAALHTLAAVDPQEFGNYIRSTSEDPAERVRIVVPSVLARKHGRWQHVLDEAHAVSARGDDSRRADILGRLDPAARSNAVDALAGLVRDPEPAVRLETFLALFSRSLPVDVNALVATISTFPDQRAVGERMADLLEENYKKMGPEFAVLVPYLKHARMGTETRRQIQRHFSDRTRPAEGPQAALVMREGRKVAAPSAAASQAEAAPNAPREPVKLVFFVEHGCDECARVEVMLRQMRDLFPELAVEQWEIGKRSAGELNKALCRQFGVPVADVRLTPSVFTGAGYLIRTDITFDRLAELVARSAGIPLSEWYATGARAPAAVTPAASTPAPAKRRGNVWAAGIALLVLAAVLAWRLTRKR